MTVKTLLLAGLFGGAIGYLSGLLIQMLPPFWAVFFGVLVSGSVGFWALREVYRIRRQRQQLNELIKRMSEYRHPGNELPWEEQINTWEQ